MRPVFSLFQPIFRERLQDFAGTALALRGARSRNAMQPSVAARVRPPMKPADTTFETDVRDVGRAFGGALIFGIPLLMTMEMWVAGFAIEPVRLLAYAGAGLGLIYVLSFYAGFSDRRTFSRAAVDALAALFVGAAMAGIVLAMLGLLNTQTPLNEAIGKTMIQTVPGAIGALLSRRQLSATRADQGEETSSYIGELFLMAVGALFLALNIAPTEEMVLLAYKATGWHTLALALASVALLHIIVFEVGFAGQEDHDRPLLAFLHFTLPGYAIVLLISLFVLWVFGRTDGHSPSDIASTMVVLGFPASLGAAAARLLV